MEIRIQFEKSGTLPDHRIGSPFGFTDQDWDYVQAELSRLDRLKVVMGYQFQSDHYESELLCRHVEEQFQTALQRRNRERPAEPVTLAFQRLAAGYGEHVFTDIVREIISADIAVFETSDCNPNVMIEMGVALTWGVPVWPIKKRGAPPLPTDVSGQTYAEYCGNGERFLNHNHAANLRELIERAMERKRRRHTEAVDGQ
jgi:hypothetical protein